MTKMTYTVICRPKNGTTGRTNIGWDAEGAKERVHLGGYMVTSRTAKGEKRQYTAVMIKPDYKNDTMSLVDVGDNHETRAQAAFAIWREYYAEDRTNRKLEKMIDGFEQERRRKHRAEVRAHRETPEGQREYREHLNAQARERRSNMTTAQKQALLDKRKAKRASKWAEDKWFVD